MKKIIISIVALALTSAAIAQTAPLPSEESKEQKKAKIESLKIAFITEKLNLTPEEAQKFWPVYNQYDAEKKAIRESTIGKYKDDGITIDQMTDEQVEQMLNDQIAYRSKELDLQKKYIAEFKKVLPLKKVAKLMTLDDQFKKHLLEKAQNMPTPPKGPKGPPPPPAPPAKR